MVAELIAAEKLPGRHSFSDTGGRSHRVSTIVFCKLLYTLPLSRKSKPTIKVNRNAAHPRIAQAGHGVPATDRDLYWDSAYGSNLSVTLHQQHYGDR